MSYIDISHTHQLDHDDAKALADEVAADLAGNYSVEYAWENGVLYFERSGAYGQIDIDDSEIRIQAELSFPLNLLKHSIESEIQKVLKQHLVA